VTLGPPSVSGAAGPGFTVQTPTVIGGAINTAPGGGATLTAPADGVVTEWRVRGSVTGVGQLTMLVAHPQGGGLYQATAQSPPAANFDGVQPNFAGNLPIRTGDQLSIVGGMPPYDGTAGSANVLATDVPGASWHNINLNGTGASNRPLDTPHPDKRLLYNATVELLPPAFATMTPNEGPAEGGTEVTITGDHLAVASSVTFGGVPAQSFSGTNETITAVAPPSPQGGPVNVAVTTAGGTSDATTVSRFTYTGGTGPDVTAPVISGLGVTPQRFKAANAGASILPRAKAPVGATVAYALSEAGSLTFAAKRGLKGRKVRGKCVRPKPSNKDKPKCTRYVPVAGSFTHEGAAGPNQFTFTGRIGGKPLKPGKYLLEGTAADSLGNASPVASAKFRIVK
jgi:hypothetical protein